MALIALGPIPAGAWTVPATALLGLWGLLSTSAPVGRWSWVAKAMRHNAEAGGSLIVAVIQLTGRPMLILSAATAAFAIILALGGVSRGHRAAPTHYDGRAIDIFFRLVTEENQREGWILAHWLVAPGVVRLD
jgi:hypothetical protein